MPGDSRPDGKEPFDAPKPQRQPKVWNSYCTGIVLVVVLSMVMFSLVFNQVCFIYCKLSINGELLLKENNAN